MLKKTAFIIMCAIFINSLSAWAFFGNDIESGILEQAISVQSPIIEFFTATTLPIKIVDELFAYYNSSASGQKQDTNKKSSKENKTPSDLSLNILNKTLDKSNKLHKSFSTFCKKLFVNSTLFMSAGDWRQGRCPNSSQCGLILLCLLAYLIVLSRKSLPKIRLNIIQKSNETRYLFSRVFYLQAIWE